MPVSEIESAVRELLVTRLGVNPASLAQAKTDSPLLGQGIGLDSVEAMTLASEIEAAFGIAFADNELNAALFSTIGSLCAAVAAKQAETVNQ